METVGGDAVEKLLDEASYSMLEHVVYKVKPVLERAWVGAFVSVSVEQLRQRVVLFSRT